MEIRIPKGKKKSNDCGERREANPFAGGGVNFHVISLQHHMVVVSFVGSSENLRSTFEKPAHAPGWCTVDTRFTVLERYLI